MSLTGRCQSIRTRTLTGRVSVVLVDVWLGYTPTRRTVEIIPGAFASPPPPKSFALLIVGITPRLCFSGNPSPCGHAAWSPARRAGAPREHRTGLLRSDSPFGAVCRSALSAETPCGCMDGHLTTCPPRRPCPCGPDPLPRVGLSLVTTVQTCVRLLTMDSLLEASRRRGHRLSPLHPASQP